MSEAKETFRPRRKSNAATKLSIQTRNANSETNNDQLVINPSVLDQVEKENALNEGHAPFHKRTQDNYFDTLLTSSSQKDNLDVAFSDAFEELEDTAKKDTITNKYLVDYDTKNLPKWKLILLCFNWFAIFSNCLIIIVTLIG